MKRHKIMILAIALLTIVLLVGCSSSNKSGGDDEKITVAVGSKEFTEQLILGQLVIQVLEDKGYDVVDRTGLGGTTVVREALETGEVDVYWEYTGTAWLVALGHENALTDSEEAFQKVGEEDLAKNNLVWLPYAQFDNTYTVMMQKDEAKSLGIETLSQLADYVNEGNTFVFATDHEFAVRPDGLPELEKVYGFEFSDVSIMDIGITYTALQEGKVPSAMGFATDGRIAAFNLVNLKDDKQFFPVYNPAPVVRKELIDEAPEVAEILGEIGPLLDTETMTKLNYLVDIENKEPDQVAQEWLIENNLISK